MCVSEIFAATTEQASPIEPLAPDGTQVDASTFHQPRKVETMATGTDITAKQQAALRNYRSTVHDKFGRVNPVNHSVHNYNDTFGFVSVRSVVVYANRYVHVEARIGKRGGFRKLQTTISDTVNAADGAFRVVKGIAWK